jgi:hypothetical protein
MELIKNPSKSVQCHEKDSDLEKFLKIAGGIKCLINE